MTLTALLAYSPMILLHLTDLFIYVEKGALSLGPQVVVGSSAFNLFFVTGLAICMAGNPKKQVQRRAVWYYTAFLSVFAFIWYFLCMVVISPNEIEVWEAVVSFLFIIPSLLIGYIIDKTSRRYKENEVIPLDGASRVEPDVIDDDNKRDR